MNKKEARRYNANEFMAFCDAERSWILSNLKHWKVNEQERYFSCQARSDVDIDFPKDLTQLGRWIKWLRGRKFITDEVLLEFIDISLIYLPNKRKVKS